MRRLFHVSVFLSLLGVLAGCGANEASIYRSYTAGSAGQKANSVLIDAKQRAILSAPGAGAYTAADPPERKREIIVCAEPSPDALSAISSTFAASAGGLFSSGDQVQAALGRALSETASQLGTRNATIQLLRDGLYRQCEAYMNGLIDKTYYEQIANKYANAMVTLLAIEELAGKGAKSQKASSDKTLNAKADVDLSAEGQSAESPASTSSESETAASASESEETTGPAGSGGSKASATAAPPVVNVNLPEGGGTVEQHVSTAVNTMVTWFLTKDTVDYCLRGLFAGTQNEDPQFRNAFIAVCSEVIRNQMAQQGQIASAYETAASAGTYGVDDCSASIRSFWKPDGSTVNSDNAARLETEMRRQGVTSSITFMMRTAESAEARRKVGAALGLAGCS